MAERVRLDVTSALSEVQVHDVALLVERVTELDGNRPLSERTMLDLLHGETDPAGDLSHICAWDGQRLIGYAVLDRSDALARPVLEIAVDRTGREAGVDEQVLDEALRLTSGHLEMWAHGSSTVAAQLAHSRGFTKSRELYRMHRSLIECLPTAPEVSGVMIRPFEVMGDFEPWLELNRRAFVDLPDQGKWTADDLQQRMTEDWFNIDGFLVAREVESNGTEGPLVGFHWTKIHRHGDDTRSGHQPVGEIYVLGVDPEQQGRGLGRALAIAGLQFLKDQGLSEVILYVESDNRAAIGTYEKLGFTIFNTDALYRSPVPARPGL